MGRVAGLFGVQGWVKVFSYTQPRDAILEYPRWWLLREGRWQGFAVVEGQRHGKSVIVRLKGVADRDAAALLVGSEIAVDRQDLPEPGQDRYYWADLEGLRVVNRDGADFGTVAYLMETGANDVLVAQGDRERLIPFLPGQVVLDVDLARGVITVDWDRD